MSAPVSLGFAISACSLQPANTQRGQLVVSLCQQRTRENCLGLAHFRSLQNFCFLMALKFQKLIAKFCSSQHKTCFLSTTGSAQRPHTVSTPVSPANHGKPFFPLMVATNKFAAGFPHPQPHQKHLGFSARGSVQGLQFQFGPRSDAFERQPEVPNSTDPRFWSRAVQSFHRNF